MPEHDIQPIIEGLNRELDSLLYTISHDVRAPLRALDGFSTALEEDYADVLDDLGRDYLRRIRRAVKRADEYMQGLLSVSRQTREDMDPQTMNLTNEVHGINHELRQRYAPRTVEAVIQPNLTCTADPLLLRTLLSALLDNAWKFTAETAEPKIEFGALSTPDSPGSQTFFLRDNGMGFDMARAEKRLFGMFQLLHDDHEQQGLGTGLAMARRIVNRHQGSIRAEGEPGNGATFFFTLPAGQEEHA